LEEREEKEEEQLRVIKATSAMMGLSSAPALSF
jgi:hypothetical protein